MINKKIILPSKLYSKAPESELSFNVELNNDSNLLREGERNIVLDLDNLYNIERNESKKYKIYGKIKMIFDNSYSGTTDYIHLKKLLYLNGDGSNGQWEGFLPYNEFGFIRTDVLREKHQYINGEQQTIIKGLNNHINIDPTDNTKFNWGVYLSYCFDKDSNYQMNYTYKNNFNFSFKSNEGIPFVVEDFENYYKLTSPIKHNIKKNEYIIISENNINGTLKERCFLINDLGDEDYNSEDRIIILNKSQIKELLPEIVIGKRCLDINDIENTISEYYIQKLKIISNINDYNGDKLEIETPIWSDEKKVLFKNFNNDENVVVEKNRMESILFDFNKPFILDKIKNNLGYTPTEIYLTIINKNKNGIFNYPPKNGYAFNFHDTWVDEHFEGTTSNEQSLTGTKFYRENIEFISGNEVTNETIINGSFVEYNKTELKEFIISESFHKLTIPPNIFNHGQNDNVNYDGISDNNLMGLFYQNNYKIKLRELSPYIEYSNTKDILNIPDNAIFSEKDNKWKWRDLYEHGFIDQEGNGTDFPFLNGTHYVKLNINFYLKNEQNFSNKLKNKKNFNELKLNC